MVLVSSSGKAAMHQAAFGAIPMLPVLMRILKKALNF